MDNVRVNRHGSITIDRQPTNSWNAANSSHITNETISDVNSYHSTVPSTTLDSLRESGQQFEQRQNELDQELERLSQQLANATPPRNSNSNNNNLPSYDHSLQSSYLPQQLPQPPQSPQPPQNAITRFTSHQHQSQRQYNWRSPGPLESSARKHPSNSTPEQMEPTNLNSNTVSARVSRRGSIIIERNGMLPQQQTPPPPQSSPQNMYDDPPPSLSPQINIQLLEELRAEHILVVDQLRSKIKELHSSCLDLSADNQEIVNELNIVRTQSAHLMAANQQTTHDKDQHRIEIQRAKALVQAKDEEVGLLRNQQDQHRMDIQRAKALLQAKDEEVGLLRDQQDRTMSLLNTCTQQRDLLVEDNRMLRQELDQLLRRFNYNQDDISSEIKRQLDESQSSEIHQQPQQQQLQQQQRQQQQQQHEQEQHRQHKQQELHQQYQQHQQTEQTEQHQQNHNGISTRVNRHGSIVIDRQFNNTWTANTVQENKIISPRIAHSMTTTTTSLSSKERMAAAAIERRRNSPSKKSNTPVPQQQKQYGNWSSSLRNSKEPLDKIFLSANRRGSTANPKESSYQVHNQRTSAAEW